jgi:glycine/D-amino acid oxidase-like deaminating enzyme
MLKENDVACPTAQPPSRPQPQPSVAAVNNDVLIIGGGVVGCAAAYFLALRGADVAVLERDPSYAFASSALSAGSIRQQFSSPVCIQMSRFGFELLEHIEARLGVDGQALDVGLVQRGYLYLAHAQQAPLLEAAYSVQRGHGVDVARLGPPDLAREFPWLRVDDLALGVIGRSGEGWFDGYALLQSLRRKAKVLGVGFITDKALGLECGKDRINAIQTSAGRLVAESFINAAGFAAGEVARWADWALPIGPERRCVFALQCAGAPLDMPLLIDPSGIYVRPEGQHFIAGGPATACGPAPCFDVDYQQFEDVIWPALARRVSAFERLRLLRGWAGQYDMNFFDHNAVIGRSPRFLNFYIAGGFSGHGMQHAAAAGRGLSELLLDGRFSTLDLSELSPARVAQNRPFRELNVI